MADYFASIFGTEKDKVNCSFYFKIGACRHGDRCSRVHNKPSFSQTILIQNLYVNSQNSAKAQANGKEIGDNENQKHFDEFYEDIYVELEEKYGPIDEMKVCDNLGDHLIGNVYVKFKSEDDAEHAVEGLNDRWFAGKPVYAELSTVTDFGEAACRQYEVGNCDRAGQCNFMHIKQISDNLKRHLFGTIKSHRRHSSRGSHMSRSMSMSRSRSVSPVIRSKSRSRSRSSSLVRPPRDDSPKHRSRSRSVSMSPRYNSSRRRNRRSRRSGRRRRQRSRSPRIRSPLSRSRSRSPISPPPPARSRTRSRSPRSPVEHSKSSHRSHKSSRKRH